MFNIFKRERSYEDLEATYPIFMAGFQEGCPCEGDQGTPDGINRNHKDFKRGMKSGRKIFNDLKQSHPEMIVNGVIRDDSDEE